MTPRLAWLRYAGPLTEEEIDEAAGRYRAVVLQPWEMHAARRLKEADPTCTVLAYKCLSSIRDYEPGPVYSSGISPALSEQLHTAAAVPEWRQYRGHRQQRVWDESYQKAWVECVVAELTGSPFDGIMADNDVWDDYYGHGLDMELVRAGLEQLVQRAGTALSDIGKVLVPNIAESRREPGRWARHSAFGGGFEECLIGWGTRDDGWLDIPDILAQFAELDVPGLIIARVPGDGSPADTSLPLAVAAAYVFWPHRDVAVTATAHDGYHAMPFIDVPDLGEPTSPIIDCPGGPGVFRRLFTRGEAWVNLGPATAHLPGHAGHWWTD
ncbi:MAG: putative glycoside hydrolase [Corynebacterium sp.]|uniref:putative glycoside hydrolase n=1 Tax=Corynebacterium sp. TaxID=1720 RepID=UPI0026DEC55D|nr:putative glycoside hydrolase [Corynebacterium sp.]MDO5668442.1 putative glycoside hydrolase [Corynebacterium sp.]